MSFQLAVVPRSKHEPENAVMTGAAVGLAGRPSLRVGCASVPPGRSPSTATATSTPFLSPFPREGLKVNTVVIHGTSIGR